MINDIKNQSRKQHTKQHKCKQAHILHSFLFSLPVYQLQSPRPLHLPRSVQARYPAADPYSLLVRIPRVTERLVPTVSPKYPRIQAAIPLVTPFHTPAPAPAPAAALEITRSVAPASASARAPVAYAQSFHAAEAAVRPTIAADPAAAETWGAVARGGGGGDAALALVVA